MTPKTLIHNKFWPTRIRLSFGVILIVLLVVIISTVSYTGFIAYKSLMQLTEVMGKSREPEIKLLLLKGISNDLLSAESSIKSYALSKDEAYMQYFNASIDQLYDKINKLDSMIPVSSPQQRKIDSIQFYVTQKIDYLKAFIEMQNRGTVINELNILTQQIDENKKLVAKLNNTTSLASKQAGKTDNLINEEKPGILKRIFKNKELQIEQTAKQEQLEKQIRKETTDKLNKQIAMLESMKLEIYKVKAKQGYKLQTFDEKELIITQGNKVYTERLNSSIVALEMDELVNTRKLTEDIDRRHNRTNRLITAFSIAAVILLIIIGFVVISFIHKKNKYQVALIAAKTEAENYSQLQERFLANMSHEIRTPMNAIAGFTEQLLKTELKVKQRSYLVIVKQSIQHLLVVINDILDYAKLRSDKLDIEFLPSSLSNTIKETTDLLNRIAAQKGIKLHVHIDSDLPDSLKFDEVRMKQVLLNLISNAIKFTDKGSVTVNATFNGEQSGDAFLVITIIDTGIGISENNLQKIFNAFEQAEVSTTRKYGGSGLGLSITQRLVQLLNGTIQIESKEGIGTQVKLQFRFQFSEQTQPEAIEQRDETDIHSVLQHKNILIADDEEWNTNLLGTILEQYDVHYTIVKNGKDVIALLHQQLFDVILMDVRMPELNGFETTKSIRKMTKPYAEIPIIGLTADTSDAQLKLCSQAGMNAVLGKPYTELDLCRLIVHNLTQKNDLHEMNLLKKAKQEKQPEAHQQEISLFYSLDILHKMSNEDEVFLIKMLRIFRDNGSQSFEQMKQGIDENDFELVADLAHKMAPSVRHLEASMLLSLLKQIEAKANEKITLNLVNLYQEAYALFTTICNDMKKKYPSV